MLQYEVWLANLNPSKGTMVGKVRPVVIVQTDLLNGEHPSTLVCPLTTRVKSGFTYLRVHVPDSFVDQPSDVLVDQLTAIDKKRLVKRLGKLSDEQSLQLQRGLKVLLDL
ncbi:MAG: type II toxin-antitoxin system PemK/MazF family toxin [Bacteroidota bacterium]